MRKGAHTFLNASRSDLTTVLPYLVAEFGGERFAPTATISAFDFAAASWNTVLERLLVGVGELVPDVAADDGEQHLGDVAGEVDVRLHLVELLRQDRRQRVLLRIHRLVLQREVDLGEGDRRGVGAARSSDT